MEDEEGIEDEEYLMDQQRSFKDIKKRVQSAKVDPSNGLLKNELERKKRELKEIEEKLSSNQQ